VFAVSEPYGHDAIPHFSETVVPLLGLAVADILCNHTTRVSECILCQSEWNSMFFLIFLVLLFVPFKPNFIHKDSISRKSQNSNTNIHIFVWSFIGLFAKVPLGPPASGVCRETTGMARYPYQAAAR
jgi:hypothetical protein